MLFAQKTRLKILNDLKDEFVEAANKNLSILKNQMISKICLKQGVTKRKAQEYIKVLLDADYIEEQLDEIYLSTRFRLNTEHEEAEKAMKEVTK